MNIKGKSKDTIKIRLDLEKMRLRSDLHLLKDEDKLKMSPTPYILSLPAKQIFCQFLKELKVPDGFSSNISFCVNMKEIKISCLKSHDCHVILKHLLPLTLCGLLATPAREALIELSMFFDILVLKN